MSVRKVRGTLRKKKKVKKGGKNNEIYQKTEPIGCNTEGTTHMKPWGVLRGSKKKATNTKGVPSQKSSSKKKKTEFQEKHSPPHGETISPKEQALSTNKKGYEKEERPKWPHEEPKLGVFSRRQCPCMGKPIFQLGAWFLFEKKKEVMATRMVARAKEL